MEFSKTIESKNIGSNKKLSAIETASKSAEKNLVSMPRVSSENTSGKERKVQKTLNVNHSQISNVANNKKI